MAMSSRWIERGSLRLRLSVAAAGLISLALLLGGAGLVLIVDRVMEQRAVEDLDRTAKFLAAQIEPLPDGSILLQQEPADPRLTVAYGGLYWQIGGAPGVVLRSRSLWDSTLAVPQIAGEARHVIKLEGPGQSRLLGVARTVELGRRDTERRFDIVVAIDRRDMQASRVSFLSFLVPSLAALGLLLILAMAAFVHRAMLPFRALHDGLRDVREGHRATLSGEVPREVRPVVDALNRLVTQQEAAMERARMQAGDMAHGLKTPLAVLGTLARRLRGSGDAAAADGIEEQVLAMTRQVDRALARARASATGGLRRRGTRVRPVAEKLCGVLRRLPADRTLHWSLAVPEGFTFAADEGDLTEMLGNVLDNARKWAAAHVRLGAEGDALVVEDDGPGMSAAQAEHIARGRRWDESRPGTGFGLAITRDLAEAGGGAMRLERSAFGGLKVVLVPPG
ncbi:ATP-binding protein [Pseudoroseomonas globiformis]|uniref:histidine kinase n=1 Tax=Teichococcus globiformis TaxID=2307229 RepID=A0ABV7G044_9PROT